MAKKWNVLRQRFAGYKYIIVVLMVILINTFYFLGYLGNQPTNNQSNISIDNVKDNIFKDNGPIGETVSSLINKTTANDTSLGMAAFKQECSKCHNSNITYSGINKEGCALCHENGHNTNGLGGPSRYYDQGIDTVHSRHVGQMGAKGCTSCHGIPACNRCHVGHSGLSLVNINVSKNCVNCHGGLPKPKGHNEERMIFRTGSHKWMGTCKTCHLQSELRFKELENYSRVNSSQLCGNCHSKQYKDSSHNKIENGIKGEENQSCIVCHNPHSPATAKFSLESTASSITNNFGNVKGYLNEHMGFVGLFFLLLLSALIEYTFRPKKGKVILSKNLRVEYDKSKAKTIKISFYQLFDSSIIDQMTDILNNNDAKIVGISAGNNEAIIFISRDNKDKDKTIINSIRSISGVSKAEYSKDYQTG